MHVTIGLLLLLITATAAAAAATFHHGLRADVPWNYDPTSPYGPDHWQEFYPMCGGQYQSPIDVVTSATQLNETLTDFVYTNFDSTDAGTFILTNTGHYMQVDILNSEISLTGGGLQDNFLLAQLHFHWERDNSIGSEHLIDGKSSTVELHIVFWNTDKYGSLEESLGQPDGIAVIGLFIEISVDGSNLNQELGELTTYFDQILYPGNLTQVPAFPLEALLPVGRSYYRYLAGLTTPPCSEGAIGTIFKDPIYITEQQVAAFRTIYDDFGELILYNVRPIQQLNDRIVYSTD